MKIETFFEKFELFADAPGAVGKMRELVRHLAITGKLVPQNSDDEPSILLLDKIIAHKSALAKEGKLRGSTSIVPMMEDDVDYMIPASWTWVRFGDVVVNRDGERIPVSKEDREARGKIYDYYGASGVIDKIDNYLFDKPLLLIGEDGANLITRSKPIAFMARGKYWVNNHAHVLDGISEDFLRYIELHINAINLERYVTGSAQPKMNQAKMNRIPIAIPPRAEQKRIVAKVDELMALCDRLEAQQQERETRHAALARASLARFAVAPAPANLNFLFHPLYTISPADLRKSILTLAVQGKLIPQDPNDESADDCLSRLGLKRSIAFLDRAIGEGDSLPVGWGRIRFEDVAVVAGGVTLGRKLGDRKTVTLPYLRVANVKRGELDLSLVKEVSIAEDEIERYALREYDLLMTEGGDWDKVGRAAIWRAEIPVCLHQNHVFRVRMRSAELVPFWFELFFNSPIGRSYFESASKQTTNLASINMRQVRSCAIPLPPLAEQRRIVAKVEQLMVLVDELEAQLAASRAVAANLLTALVAELTGTPEGRVAAPAPAKPIASAPRPKPQKTTVATAKPAAQESTFSPRTLANLRRAAGLTQGAVAEAMGLNQAYISQMETGKRPITKEQHSNLLEIFGMIADEIPR